MTAVEHEAERPKRLSLSQIVELLLTRPTRDRSSVSLSRNAAGEVVIDVTAHAAEGETLEDAERIALAAFERMSKRYPRKDAGHDNGEVTFTRNAKGETQISVSAKTGDQRLKTLAGLEAETRKVYDNARMKYPMADGMTAKPGSVA